MPRPRYNPIGSLGDFRAALRVAITTETLTDGVLTAQAAANVTEAVHSALAGGAAPPAELLAAATARRRGSRGAERRRCPAPCRSC